MAAMNTMETLLTLLAGMGMTQLPKLMKSMGGMAPAPVLPGTEPGDDVMGFFLQMLGNGPSAPQAPMPGPAPAPAPEPTPAAMPRPRFPSGRARPLMPRVANLNSQLGL